jgi:hypothetical protein
LPETGPANVKTARMETPSAMNLLEIRSLINRINPENKTNGKVLKRTHPDKHSNQYANTDRLPGKQCPVQLKFL